MKKFKSLGWGHTWSYGLYFNKLKSPYPRMLHAKYQCILVSGSWEKDFWWFTKIFLILPLIGPQKGSAPLFKHIWILILQAWFLPSLVEIGQVVLEKKSFKGKTW